MFQVDQHVNAREPASALRAPASSKHGGMNSVWRRMAIEEDSLTIKAKTEDRGEGPITLLRFANRVPLQYQQSACAIFKAVVDTSWKSYGLSQPRGGLPVGPMVLLVHIASVWVPFTSESKEAIAHYPEIIKEMKLALREVGRKLNAFLRRREKDRLQEKRRSIFSKRFITPASPVWVSGS